MKPKPPHSDPFHTGSTKLADVLSDIVIGQPTAINSIVPYIDIHEAGLAPEGRPAGVFLLLGPTGTGKTRTVEALAEAIHGSPKKLLKVDCGEFQMEHEVAKLIGAPPGYLGHRETQPVLTQAKLNAATSNYSDLSIVLFDEIEKAAPSMTRLLLGVLDKATLRLGDNTLVNFEKSVIFLTSNLGARSMGREMRPAFGFETVVPRDRSGLNSKLESIAMNAVRKKFSPEFINRIDAVITYQPLGPETLALILDQHLEELQEHLDHRLGDRAFRLEVPPKTRKLLLKLGTSREFGARELKRTIHRELLQPIAHLVASGDIRPHGTMRAEANAANSRIVMKPLDKPHPPVALEPAA